MLLDYEHPAPPHAGHAIAACYFASLLSANSGALPLVARREKYAAGADTGAHRHEDFVALYTVRGGRGTHRIDGQPYAMARGDVYAMPPGAIHAYANYCALEVDAFYFQPALFSPEENAALRALPGFWSLFLSPSEAPSDAPGSGEVLHRRLHLSPERRGAVENAIEEMRTELRDGSPAALLLARGALFRLLVTLSRWHAGASTSGAPGTSSTGAAPRSRALAPGLAEVLRVCEERFCEPLPVARLAALAFLSPAHFSEVFAREVGMPPAAYIRHLRLERAQVLLRSGDESASAIAHAVGFNSAAQFSRVFKAAFGVSPSEYRAVFGARR
jgi:AraC-like DNA-binding protein